MPGDLVFREEVADHYRQKGYSIRENVKVRGKSGAIHACDMVATSPLGNLIVAFEDEGGFEGPEMNAVRRTARDIGATPVVAAQHIPAGVRKHAAAAGVVLVDPEALTRGEPTLPEPSGVEYPPWPGTEIGPEQEEKEAPPWPGGGGRAAMMAPVEVDKLVDDVARRNARRGTVLVEPEVTPVRVQTEAPVGVQSRAAQASQHASSQAAGDFAWLPRTEVRAEKRTKAEPAPQATSSMTFYHWAALAAIFGATVAGIFYALLRLVG